MSKPINSQAHLFTYFFMAAFVLQLQSWEVVTETGWSVKFMVCTIWAFTEDSLLTPALCPLYTQVQFGFLIFSLSETLKIFWTLFFFSRKNSTAILLWKNSDSLGWFEMTLLVSPAWNPASLSHLNTSELSLTVKPGLTAQPELLLFILSALWV